jgi:hypothetical protein
MKDEVKQTDTETFWLQDVQVVFEYRRKEKGKPK